jgi:hypothetical protein
VLLVLGIPLAALASERGTRSCLRRSDSELRPDVALIVREAHRLPSGRGTPFPLETARQISSAGLIAAAVRARVMPPWPPGARSPAYVGQEQRTLSAAERATILAWARAGGKTDGPALGRKPLQQPPPRAGESTLRLRMPSAYEPRAAKGVTDDYRCFLLDPRLAGDASVTSARIEPGAAKVVHHVILFRVAASQVASAKSLDASSAGPGWGCFGGPACLRVTRPAASRIPSTTRAGSRPGRPGGERAGFPREPVSPFPPAARW